MAKKLDKGQSKSKTNINIVLAVILLLYPLRHVTAGVDLMDAGYALGNYRYFDVLNKTWKLATYLANVAGVALSHLPFGGTWVGMNVYTGLLTGMTAAAVFLFFVRRYGHKYLMFAAEFVALSLCWAPSVILYHYLGYFLMTAASLLLFSALTKNNRRYLIISGVILGLCVGVRMPNITYMAFILPVWYDCLGREKSFRALINRTLMCIAGYLAGILVPLGFIGIRYGFRAYPEMVSALFGMTETATDYQPASMITAMFGDYIRYSAWFMLFLVYMAAGFGFFALVRVLAKGREQKKITDVFKALYLLGLFVVLRLCYGRGMFNFDYTAYFSMYKWVTVYLLLVVALCVWCLACRGVHEELKLWAVFVLVTVFVTPLGSNNGLHPIINNLFLVAPASILMAAEAFRCSKALKDSFVFKSVVSFVLACTAFQGIFFGIGFVFHDALPAGEERVALSLQSSDRADGLRTTKAKKEQLEALDRFLVEQELTSHRLILFGDVPALAYLFDMEPAVFTTWPDLDSNSLAQLQQDLDEIRNDNPVIILGMQSVNRLDEESGIPYQKLRAIEAFMEQKGYAQVYAGEDYAVYR